MPVVYTLLEMPTQLLIVEAFCMQIALPAVPVEHLAARSDRTNSGENEPLGELETLGSCIYPYD